MTDARKIVVTGGSFSGKSTLIAQLATHGFSVVEETAIRVIEDLLEQEQRGDRPPGWRFSNPVEFQLIIAREQARREAQSEAAGVQFLDRGLHDGIGYLRYQGIEPPAELVRLAHGRDYVLAIVLDTLARFRERRETGRRSTREDSVRIGELIESTYREFRITTVRLPESSIDERRDAVLRLAKGAVNGLG